MAGRDRLNSPSGQPVPRVHLLAHANPLGKDLARFGLTGLDAYIELIRASLPRHWRLTFDRRILEAREDEQRGGRRDDRLRIADLQGALDDPATCAIVALSGGGWFGRILPHVDFSPLARRRRPLWALGFSELTGLVNLVASFRCGRGVYWLCPNYLAWKIRPAAAAREAFASFWHVLAGWIEDSQWPRPPGLAHRSPPGGEWGLRRGAGTGRAVSHRHAGADTLDLGTIATAPIRGRLASGQARSGPIRVLGGCLSVLAAFLPGPLARRLRPHGAWLAIEDIHEAPYRIDRHLSALKFAGWFEHLAGVLVGDFHTADEPDQRRAVREILRFHLPDTRVPVVVTDGFGHRWPMTPLRINRTLTMTVHDGAVKIE